MVAAGRSVYTNLSVIISVCISLTVGNLRTSHFASTMSAAGKLIYVFSRVHRHSHTCSARKMGRCERRREWGAGEIYGLKLNPPTLPPSTMRVRVRGTDTVDLAGFGHPHSFAFRSLRVVRRAITHTFYAHARSASRAHTHITLNPAWPGGVCVYL